MRKNILFILVAQLFLNITNAQKMKTLLGKAFTSKDSSDYYFKIAQKSIKTPEDEAEYFFCKNARCNDYGILDSSIVYGEIAIKKLKTINDYNSMCYVYHNMSKAYNKQGNYEKAIKVLLLGLKISEKENIEYWTNHFTTSISLNYHDFESYEKGVFYGLKAVELAKKSKNGSFEKMTFALNTLAINYDDWNKPEKALYYHYKNVKLSKEKDSLLLASTYNNIGNTLLKQKKFSESQKWFNRSLKITNINFENKPKDAIYYYTYSTIYTNLAAIAYQLNNFEKAQELFEKAEFHAKNSKDAEKLRDYYQHFYLFNKKRGNLEKTIDSQEKYLILRDSVFKTKRDETFAELEAKYQNEKKEKELSISKSLIIQKDLETKQKNNQLIITSILALGFLVIGFLIYRQQKLKIKQQEQEYKLKNAITQIETQNKLQKQRLSISRDLHDNIGAQLTFIISSIDNVKYAFDISNKKLDSKLSSISNFAKETIVELRDTIWAMNSTKLPSKT